jgi:ABC-2 type transport system permease protein
VLTTLAAFLRRDFAVNTSYRVGFVLELLSDVFSLALFFYLGRLVDPGPTTHEELAHGYFPFAIVGIALLGIVQASLGSFGQKLRLEQTTGTFEALMSTPAPRALLIFSSAAYEVIRATAGAVVFVALGIAFFGLRFTTNPLPIFATLLALLAGMVLFVAGGVAVAAFTVVFKQATPLVRALVPMLALLGGVYFPVELLPHPLHVVSNAVPFTWTVDAVRDGLIQGEVDSSRLLLLFLAAAAAVPISIVLFDRGLRRARMAGSLGQY